MIINLTQHPASPEQIAAGVVDPFEKDALRMRQLLTFEWIPSPVEIQERARLLAELAEGQLEWSHEALIGGAPYLMAPLERALLARGITPLYSFSTRESVETTQPDGSVRKVNTFRHAGFVGGLS